MKNEALFARMKKLVRTERRIGTAVLECLEEIDRRRAYADLHYDGLFSYCVKELCFTDAQAWQRIQAMRALRDVPVLKEKIESGALSVSAVAKVQSHFRQEARAGTVRSKPERLELFMAMENRTSREVEAKLSEARGEEVREKLVLEMDSELKMLWEKVKNLAAHRSKGDAAEALKIVTREWIERNDPARSVRRDRLQGVGGRRRTSVVEGKSSASNGAVPVVTDEASGNSGSVPVAQEQASANSRAIPVAQDQTLANTGAALIVQDKSTMRLRAEAPAIKQISRRTVPFPGKPYMYAAKLTSLRREDRYAPPAALKRAIWIRDGGKCTRCDSKHAVELDHTLPFACGGETSEENLRLLCRSCNLAASRQTFGSRTFGLRIKHDSQRATR